MNNAERIKKWAIVGVVIEQLKEHGKNAQCGETRIQKALYLAKEMFGIPMPDYDFTVYRFGPYSDDVSSDLVLMEMWDVISKKIESVGRTYSFQLDPDDEENSRRAFDDCKKQYGDKIAFIAKTFGDGNVGFLERLTTAFWVVRKMEGKSVDEMAAYLCKVKGYLTTARARACIKRAQKMIKEAEQAGLLPA